jgi:hypothetical protein
MKTISSKSAEKAGTFYDGELICHFPVQAGPFNFFLSRSAEKFLIRVCRKNFNKVRLIRINKSIAVVIVLKEY